MLGHKARASGYYVSYVQNNYVMTMGDKLLNWKWIAFPSSDYSGGLPAGQLVTLPILP